MTKCWRPPLLSVRADTGYVPPSVELLPSFTKKDGWSHRWGHLLEGYLKHNRPTSVLKGGWTYCSVTRGQIPGRYLNRLGYMVEPWETVPFKCLPKKVASRLIQRQLWDKMNPDILGRLSTRPVPLQRDIIASVEAIQIPYLMGVDPWNVPFHEYDLLTLEVLEGFVIHYRHAARILKDLKKVLRHALFSCRVGPRPDVPALMQRPELQVALKYYPIFTGYMLRLYGQVEISYDSFTLRNFLMAVSTRAVGTFDMKFSDDSLRKTAKSLTSQCWAGQDRPPFPALPERTCEHRVHTGFLSCLQELIRKEFSLTDVRISSSTTSVLESSRRKGGHAGYLSRWQLPTRGLSLSDGSEISIEGKSSMTILQACLGEVSSGGSTGRWAGQDMHWSDVRLSVVCEPGKHRVITIPSFFYRTVLDACSHGLLPCFKGVSAVSDSLTGVRSRPLWSFLQDRCDPNTAEGSELISRDTLAGCSDLTEATDHSCLGTAAIELWSAIISAVPEEVKFLFQVAGHMFLSLRKLTYSRHGGNRTEVFGFRTSGWLMGDPFTKVLLAIVGWYSAGRLSWERPRKLVWRCCHGKPYTMATWGDDLVRLSTCAECVGDTSAFSGLGFLVSELDTWVGRVIAYCEEYSLVPRDPRHTIPYYLRHGTGLPYLDVPRIRLLLATGSGESICSTLAGKASQHAKEILWTHLVGLDPLMIASGYIQSVLFGRIWADDRFIYPFLPRAVGGTGFLGTKDFFQSYWEGHLPREITYHLSAWLDSGGQHLVQIGNYHRSLRGTSKFQQELRIITERIPPSILNRGYVPEGSNLLAWRGPGPEKAEKEAWAILTALRRFFNLLSPADLVGAYRTFLFYEALFEGRWEPDWDPFSSVAFAERPGMPAGYSVRSVDLGKVYELSGMRIDRNFPVLIPASAVEYIPLTPFPGVKVLRTIPDGLISELHQIVLLGGLNLEGVAGLLSGMTMVTRISTDEILVLLIKRDKSRFPGKTLILQSSDIALARRLRSYLPFTEVIICHPLFPYVCWENEELMDSTLNGLIQSSTPYVPSLPINSDVIFLMDSGSIYHWESRWYLKGTPLSPLLESIPRLNLAESYSGSVLVYDLIVDGAPSEFSIRRGNVSARP